MRLLLTLAGLLIAVSSLGQWTDRETPTFAAISHIQVIDNNTIFFTGETGLYKSTDAGLTWMSYLPYNFPDYTNLSQWYMYSFSGKGMHFINGTTGFLYVKGVLGHQIIYKTSNGGSSFFLVYNKLGGEITSMQFATASIGYAATTEGKVIKTIDGGDTWTELAMINTAQLNGLHFTDATHGVFVGTNVILATSDGGDTWTTTTTTKFLKHVTHADNQKVFASGDYHELVKSIDGGATWTDASLNNIPPDAYYFNRVLFISSTTAFLSTSVGLFKTTDGGNFWAPQRGLGKGSSSGLFDMLPNGTGFLNYGNPTLAPTIRFAYTTTAGEPMPEHEAAATELISYPDNLCRGVYPISLRIVNHSNIPLTTVVVKWKVNEVSQPDYNWTGNLTPGATSDPVQIGSFNFTKTARDYTIIASTSMPNGAADPYTDDDATEQSYRFNKLTGDYLIGGANGDFATINEPIALLQPYGMCTAVTLNISPGTYPEYISLQDVTATSATNRLTFQSSTGNAVDVIVGDDQFGRVFTIDNTPHITLRRLTLKSGTVIGLVKNVDDVVIEDNILTATVNFSNEHGVVSISQATGNVLIRNNRFSGADMGIFHSFWSQGGTPAEVTIDKNVFENHTSQAMYLSQNINVNFTNNILRVAANGHNFDNYVAGLWFYQYAGEAKVVNNFIEVLTTGQETWAQGVYAYRVTGKISLFNNTIYKRSIASNAAVMINESKNITLKNNSITSFGNGDVFAFTESTNISSDYNNLFSLKGNTGTYKSPTKDRAIAAQDVTSWQLATNGLDLHSISADPQHIEGNIHVSLNTSNQKLNGAGTPIAGVTTDIDGEARNVTTPDIGCDEFNAPTVDVGISASPKTVIVCGPDQVVNFTVTNYGTTTVNGLNLNWSLNGTNESGSNSQSILPGDYVVVTIVGLIGQGTLSVSASTSGDMVSTNNTASIEIRGNGMSGTYTVGGTTPNFATIGAAVAALQTNGVCDDVTINIRPGSYNENISVGIIPGTAEDRQVIFQSSTRDSTDVKIVGNKANIQFAKTSWVTVRNISIGDPDPNVYNLIKFDLFAVHHMTIEGNRITSLFPLNVASNSSNPAPSEYNIIRGNNFSPPAIGSSYTLRVVGNIDSDANGWSITRLYSRGNVIEGNIFTANPPSTQTLAVVLTAQDGFRVANNRIDLVKDEFSSATGLYVTDAVNAYSITGNDFGRNGISLASSINENSEMGLIANNFINGGFFVHYADNFRFVNNTVVTEFIPPSHSPGSWGAAVLINAVIGPGIVGGPDHIEFKNNIIAASGELVAVAFYPGIVESDYNVFFSSYANKMMTNSAGSLGEQGYSTFYQTFPEWQSGTGLDAHSYFFEPTFVSATDYHIANDIRLSRKGTNVGVTTDIDGEGRFVTSPDIGADEFTLFNTDAGVVAFTTELICGPGTDLKVKIKNFSKNTLTQASIRWSVNNVEQTPKAWTGSLASKQTSAAVSVGAFNFQTLVGYTLKFWTDLPNGIADENNVNDAITRGPYQSLQSGDFSIQAPSGSNVFCLGNPPTLTVNVPQEFNYTYAWKKGADVVGGNQDFLDLTIGGTYSVTISTAGCVFTPAPVTITEVVPPAAPTVTANSALEFCQGGTVKLGVPVGSLTYTWSNGQTTNDITVTTSGGYSAKVSDQYGCQSASSPVVQVTVNPLPGKPAIAPNGSLTFCDGGSVELAAPSGLTSYQWSSGEMTPSITVNATGSFSVIVKDAKGCESLASNITQVEEYAAVSTPVVTVDGQTTFCDGGSVVLHASVGFASYSWSNGETTKDITVASTGDYKVSVKDDHGCESPLSAQVSVTEHAVIPVPEIEADGPLQFCNGGDVVLSAPAGFSSYTWSSGETTKELTASGSGTYSVKVLNGGCESPVSDEVQVTEYNEVPTPAITLISGSFAFCEGGSATLAAPENFASYTWSNGETTRTITVTTESILTVTLGDEHGCKGSPSGFVGIGVKKNPIAEITLSGTQLNATPGGDSYQWYFEGDDISAATTAALAPGESGSYTVKVTKNGCTTMSDDFKVIISGLEQTSGFQIYPNPASSYIVLRGPSIGEGTFEFHDATGRIHDARVKDRRENEITLSLEGLSSGIYFIQGTLKDTIIRYRIILASN